jgi:hypothetical protein
MYEVKITLPMIITVSAKNYYDAIAKAIEIPLTDPAWDFNWDAAVADAEETYEDVEPE